MDAARAVLLFLFIFSLKTERTTATTTGTILDCHVAQIKPPLFTGNSATTLLKGNFSYLSSSTLCQDGEVTIACYPAEHEAMVLMMYSKVTDCRVSNTLSVTLPCEPITVECIYTLDSTLYSSGYIHIIRETPVQSPHNVSCISGEDNSALFEVPSGLYTILNWLINNQSAPNNFSSEDNFKLSVPCAAEFDQAEIAYIIEYRGGQTVTYIAGWMNVIEASEELSNSTEGQDKVSNPDSKEHGLQALQYVVAALSVALAVFVLLTIFLAAKAYCQSKTISLMRSHREKRMVYQTCLWCLVEDYDSPPKAEPPSPEATPKGTAV